MAPRDDTRSSVPLVPECFRLLRWCWPRSAERECTSRAEQETAVASQALEFAMPILHSPSGHLRHTSLSAGLGTSMLVDPGRKRSQTVWHLRWAAEHYAMSRSCSQSSRLPTHWWPVLASCWEARLPGDRSRCRSSQSLAAALGTRASQTSTAGPRETPSGRPSSVRWGRGIDLPRAGYRLKDAVSSQAHRRHCGSRHAEHQRIGAILRSQAWYAGSPPSPSCTSRSENVSSTVGVSLRSARPLSLETCQSSAQAIRARTGGGDFKRT